MIGLRTRDVARLLLVSLSLAMAVFMLGPFQQLEHDLIPWDKAAHFMAFYAGTALLYVAVPGRRRLDLSTLVAFAGVGSELVQGMVGRDCDAMDMVADLAGAYALYLPVWLDHLRRPAQEERRRGADARDRLEPAPGL
jgi:VanZ family protein